MLKDKNLYYVGGVVRDEILGTASFDTDFCYEGDAIEFAKRQGLNVVKENPDFATVRVLVDIPHPQPLYFTCGRGENKNTSAPSPTLPRGEGELQDLFIDIASTREEYYPHAGHLPVVKNIGCSLKNDLKRRDFTINAMAKNTVSGEIVDYFGGMQDIKNKKLRVLHKNSFIDDPTRIIRALKFAVRFGFELDEETKELQDKYLANINYDMSYHRLKKELKETFNLNKEETFKRFIEQGIYKLLGNNITPSQPCLDSLALNGNSDFCLSASQLQTKNLQPPLVNRSPSREGVREKLISKYKPIYPWIVYMGLFDLSKLELTGEEKKILDSIPTQKPETDFEVYKMFKDIPLESILLYALSVDYNIACHYLDDLKSIKITLTGDDLKIIGVPNGKVYKEIFDCILKEKIKNPKMLKQDELNFVKEKYGYI